MHAQILVAEEMEDLAGRVTDAVLAVLVNRARQLSDPALRSAVGAVVVTAREQLACAPVDAEPLVWAILHGEPVAAEQPADAADVLAAEPTAEPVAEAVPLNAPVVPGTATPAYWPAVPEISDELFAEYAAKGGDEHPDDFYVNPQHTDETHTDETHADEAHADDSPAAPEPAAEDVEAEPKPVHGGRFHARPLRRRKKSRQ